MITSVKDFMRRELVRRGISSHQLRPAGRRHQGQVDQNVEICRVALSFLKNENLADHHCWLVGRIKPPQQDLF